MMPTPLRLLLIEDDEGDALFIVRQLRDGGYDVVWERVDAAPALEDALRRQVWDLITCDWVMPGFGAPQALALLEKHRVEAPIIIVSGEVGEEVAVTAMKAGAHDFVSKHKLARLVPVVARELGEVEDRRARKRAEEATRTLNGELEQRVRERTAQLEAANAEIARTMEERRAIEEQRRLAIDAADLGVWSWEISENRLVWTSQVHRLFGVQPGVHLSHEYFLSALHPDDREKVDQIVQQALAKGEDYRAEYRVVWPDGSIHWLNSIGRTTYDVQGHPQRMIGVVFETTESKRAEESIWALNRDLERRTVQLEAANRELEAFVHSVSHDLRAPLRHMDAFSRLLLEEHGSAINGEGKVYLERIREGAQHMAQLIGDLLALSRVTRQEMAYDDTDLSELANAVAADLHNSEPHRQVEVVITPGLLARGDPRLLRVLLENLLGNAWKYTSKHPTARISFGSIEGNGRVAYFVRDDGAGFDMEYAGKLFGAFQRLHSASEFEGTGVGLATVQRIVHRHGGRVWAEGAPEQGATFYFTLDTSES